MSCLLADSAGATSVPADVSESVTRPILGVELDRQRRRVHVTNQPRDSFRIELLRLFIHCGLWVLIRGGFAAGHQTSVLLLGSLVKLLDALKQSLEVVS